MAVRLPAVVFARTANAANNAENIMMPLSGKIQKPYATMVRFGAGPLSLASISLLS
jgi:hypothetical protein